AGGRAGRLRRACGAARLLPRPARARPRAVGAGHHAVDHRAGLVVRRRRLARRSADRRGGADALPYGTGESAVSASRTIARRRARGVSRRARRVGRRAACDRFRTPARVRLQSQAMDRADDRRRAAGGAAMILRRIAAGTIVAVACAVAYVLACGPFVEEIPTVTLVEPAHAAAYAKGTLGVVRPRLARRYLVQAYRVLSGRPSLGMSSLRPGFESAPAASSAPQPKAPEVEWSELAGPIAGPAAVAAGQMQKVPGDLYQEFLNCPGAAFDNAIRTLRTRAERYGERSAATVAWVRAQQTVFANCVSPSPAIPEALPAAADPVARADREYQIASAWF